uniref:Uncharacterized protein n=1 Tax=Rhizophora mucronata TaxID=61149 RepID=A0A2P2K7K4_RHIMU
MLGISTNLSVEDPVEHQESQKADYPANVCQLRD